MSLGNALEGSTRPQGLWGVEIQDGRYPGLQGRIATPLTLGNSENVCTCISTLRKDCKIKIYVDIQYILVS